MKKGQITIFVILGIVIAAVALLAFFFRSTILELSRETTLQDVQTSSPLVYEAGSQVENCLLSHHDFSLRVLGLQGSIKDPKESIEYAGSKIALYKEGILKEDLEKELEGYFAENALSCLDIATSLKLEPSGIKGISASIEKEKVSINLDWPITFKTKDTTQKISHFEVQKDLRLGDMIDDINAVLAQSKEGLCLSCLADLGETKNYLIEVETAEQNVVTIRDKNYFLDDLGDTEPAPNEFVFRFAVGEL